MRLRAFGALVALCSAAVFIPLGTASAQVGAQTLEIRAGALLEGSPAESMRFFPADITVHKGDTLKFMGEFHTATMLPVEATDADAWIAENASAPDQPFAVAKANPDNATFPLKLLGDDPFAPNPECGSPETPCTYSGADVVDSGALLSYAEFSETGPPTFTGFSVTVDANPGDVFWVICRIHPMMRMRVAVALPNNEATSQADIDTYTEATIAEDTRAASELHESLLGTRSSRMVNGHRVWTAYAGFDTDTVALSAFYPRKLNVRKGDRVAWRFSALNHEVHTVTFANKRGVRFANRMFAELCDPNGDAEAGGETQAQGFPPMCDPGVHESLFRARAIGEVGNGAVRGKKDLEHSGIGGAFLRQERYRLRFPRKSDGFRYLCAIHPFMRGVVRVR